MGAKGRKMVFARSPAQLRTIEWIIKTGLARLEHADPLPPMAIPLTAKSLASIADRPPHTGEPDCFISDERIYDQLQAAAELRAPADFAFYEANPNWPPELPIDRRQRPVPFATQHPIRRKPPKNPRIPASDHARGRWGRIARREVTPST